MSECWIAEELTPCLNGTDPEALFAQLDQLSGEIYRQVASRRTLRVAINHRNYFLKVHYGAGWGEIFKNLFQARLPVLGARNERDALERLTRAGVPTMQTMAYVEVGDNPATRRSAILTAALENRTSLEFYDPVDPLEKRRLLTLIAGIARDMHTAGVNHRDFYICHFLMSDDNHDDIRLIDLHRAQVRKQVPARWRVKDLGGLLFSAMDKGLTRRDLLRFLKVYSGKSPREFLAQDRRLWRRVQHRARQLYRQEHGELPPHVIDLLGGI